MKQFNLTEVISETKVCKEISLVDDQLVKKSNATIFAGEGKTQSHDMGSFCKYINNLKDNECLLLGTNEESNNYQIISDKEVEDKKIKFRRTKENFSFTDDGHQLIMFDFDEYKESVTPEKFIEIINEVVPGFKDCQKVIKKSSSAGIINKNTNVLLNDNNSFHLYVLIDEESVDFIEDVFAGNDSILTKRLWLNGYGYIKNTKNRNPKKYVTGQLCRTIYDSAVFSPERIIFETFPQLCDGLIQERKQAKLIQGTPTLNLQLVEPLTEEDEVEFQELILEQKKENAKTLKFQAHKKKFINSYSKVNKVNKSVAEGKYNNLQRFKLSKDTEIILTNGEVITVEEIMDDPQQYHNETCHDVYEPSYGNSQADIGKIYYDEKKRRLIIHSFAHSGINYSYEEKSEQMFDNIGYWKDNFYLYTENSIAKVYHIHNNRVYEYSKNSLYIKFTPKKIYNEETKRKVSICSHWLENIDDKNYINGRIFAPNKPPILKNLKGDRVLNTYIPDCMTYNITHTYNTQDKYRSAKPFIDLLKLLFPKKEEFEVIVQFYAYLLQKDERPSFALLICSLIHGTGKDLIIDILQKMWGNKLISSAKIKALGEDSIWGDVFDDKKLVVFSELGTDQSDKSRLLMSDASKFYITARMMEINKKNGIIETKQVYPGMVFHTNSKESFVFDERDRRYFCVRVQMTQNEQKQLSSDGYFQKIANFYLLNEMTCQENLLGLYYYLLSYNVTVNFKGNAPMTDFKRQIILNNKNDEVSFFEWFMEKYKDIPFFKKFEIQQCYKSFAKVDSIPDIEKFDKKLGQLFDKTERLSIYNDQKPLYTLDAKNTKLSNDKIREIYKSNNIKKYLDDSPI